MKAALTLVLALLSSVAWAQTYDSPVRIARFDRTSGALAWTNSSPCVNVPVYELLRAASPTGTWQHFSFLTNGEMESLPNPLGQNPGAIFYKLAWVSDAPMLFDYRFDEGYGYTSVTGRLSLNFCASGTNVGTWFCENTEYVIDGQHPTAHNPCGGGLGNFCPPPREVLAWSGPHPFWGGGAGATPTNVLVRLYFTPGSEGIYLDGSMRLGDVNGRRAYASMSGTVYRCGFAGCDPIGTFSATRITN